MEHSYFQDRLSAYHDNELPLQEKVVVEEHVKGCDECQKLLDQYRRLDDLVAGHGQLAETDYWERSAREIDRAIGVAPGSKMVSVSAARRKFDIGWKIAALAATVIIVGYIGIHKDDILRPVKVVPPSSAPGTSQSANLNDTAKPKLSSPAPSKDASSEADERSGVKKSHQTSTTGAAENRPDDKEPQNYKSDRASVKNEGGASEVELNSIQRKVVDESGPQAAAGAPSMVSDSLDRAAPVSQAAREVINKYETANQTTISADAVKQRLQLAASKVDTGLGLTYWRGVRDSILPKSSDAKDLALAAKVKEGITSSLQKPAQRAQSAAAPIDTSGTSTRLLEAWYQIARLSTDSAEKNQARAVLSAIATSKASTERDLARAYLDSLEKK